MKAKVSIKLRFSITKNCGTLKGEQEAMFEKEDQ
jgi:hypothetical protein